MAGLYLQNFSDANHSDTDIRSEIPQSPLTSLLRPDTTAYSISGGPQRTVSSFSQRSDYGLLSHTHFQPRPTSEKSSLVGAAVTDFWLKTLGKQKEITRLAAPLFAAPWRHDRPKEYSSSAPPSDTVRQFRRRRQARRTFVNGFIEWLVPLSFTICLTLVLYTFDKKTRVTKHQRIWFNVLVTGFSLCLGFAVTSGLRKYAELMKWRLLSGKYHRIQDFDLIMGCSSQLKALRLLWSGRDRIRWTPNHVQMLGFLYLAITFGLQVFVACLGLTYSVDDNSNMHYLIRGNTSVADLSKIIIRVDDIGFAGQSGSANSYGIMSAQRFAVEKDLPFSKQNYLQTIYTYSNESEWWYNMIDRNPNSNAHRVVSSRQVRTHANCTQHSVLSGGYIDTNWVEVMSPSGQPVNLTLHNIAPLTTTWLANGNQTCGPRCTVVEALNAGYVNKTSGENYSPSWYSCYSWVDQPLELQLYPDDERYNLPDLQARLLAGAIAWSGIHAVNGTWQEHNYPTSSIWSWFGRPTFNSQTMASLIMRFASGTLASIDDIGPRVYVDGFQPNAALTVNVEWPKAIPALVIVPTIQLIVFICAVVYSTGAVVRDDTYLSAARLYQPIIEKLGAKASAMTGDEIAEYLGNYRIAYGVRMAGPSKSDTQFDSKTDAAYHSQSHDGSVDVEYMQLDIVAESQHLGSEVDHVWVPGQKMPAGKYD